MTTLQRACVGALLGMVAAFFFLSFINLPKDFYYPIVFGFPTVGMVIAAFK